MEGLGEVCECLVDVVSVNGLSEKDEKAVTHLRLDMGFRDWGPYVLGS